MRPSRLAAFGLGLSAAMQAVFFATGAERGPLYLALQVGALVASGAAAWGAATGNASPLAAGLWGNALTRILHVALDLTRLPLWVNLLLFAAYVVAAVGATLAAVGGWRSSRTRTVRMGFWLVALGYLASMQDALSGGRLSALLALLLGTLGFLLAAPDVRDEPMARAG